MPLVAPKIKIVLRPLISHYLSHIKTDYTFKKTVNTDKRLPGDSKEKGHQSNIKIITVADARGLE